MTSDGDLGPGSASCVCNDGDIDAVIGSGVCSDAESFDLHSYFVGEQLEQHEVFVNFSNEWQLVLPCFVVLQLHSADFVPQTPTQHMLSPFQLTKVNFAPVNLELVS